MQEVFEKIIERLEENKELYVKMQTAYCSPNKLYEFIGKEQAMNLAIEIVNQVAEEFSHRTHDLDIEVSHSKDGWIPCSERLPIGEDFIIRIEGEAPLYKHLLVSVEGYEAPVQVGWYDQKYEIWFDLIGFAFQPIAWQPLPEPYKPQKEGVRHE